MNLDAAWNLALAALPDRQTDFLWLEGPLGAVDQPEFYRATFVGWGPGRLVVTASTPQDALVGIADELDRGRDELIAWRAKHILSMSEFAGNPTARPS